MSLINPHARGEDDMHVHVDASVSGSPHARGEDIRGAPGAFAAPALTPRAWGRYAHRHHDCRGLRFTPTRVGKMISRTRLSSASSVHPHARGEDAIIVFLVQLLFGSPPRAWGRCESHPRHRRRARFTPTRVGKIHPMRIRSTVAPVHPHARGEDAHARRPQPGCHGSPPRAWGRYRQRAVGARTRRFTPTRVGKMRNPVEKPAHAAVHPHARGEDVVRLARDPPHSRFTPTRVGKIRASRRCAYR